jgi:hypothetical protein
MIKAGKYYSASCLCSGELQNSISGYKGSPCTHFCNRECPTARSLSFTKASLGGTILVRPLGSWLLLVVLVSTGTYLLTMVSTYHVALWAFSEIIRKINPSNWFQICPLSYLNQSKSCFKSLPRKFSLDFIRLNWTTYVKFWILILSIWCAQFVILESKFQTICLPPDKFNLIS